MKSIFKKIAFVLALAMVVTMLPAKTAAAASDGPQMYSTLKLYVGGDKTGNYAGERFAKVWNKDGYTVSFVSDNEAVAAVNAKSGRVTAVSVGTANVTATFTAEDGTVVNKTCVVTVKKNAVAAGLSSASTKLVTETGIAVGETVQLTAVRKYAAEDGTLKTVWKGRDIVTDGVRFASSDESIFTVQKTTGKITGVAAGEATLKVWAVQSEGKDPVTGEYPATTEVKEYTVKVIGFSAEATGVKEITVSGAFTKDSKFEVKKGNQTINTTATVAEDGKTAVLATDTKLTKGTYKVSCGNSSAEITVEDEKVASIVVLENGGMVTTNETRTQIYVHYDVLNQYGESVRKNYEVQWTSSTGGTVVRNDKENGVLTIGAGRTAADTITYGTAIILTGVHTATGNVATVTANLTAGLENCVSSIKVAGITKENSNELLKELPAGFVDGEYLLVYKMVDRLGYAMDYSDAQALNLTFTSLSPLLLASISSTDFVQGGVVIDGVQYGAVRLHRGLQTKQGGVARIQITSTKTGTSTSCELNIVSEQVLDSFQIIAPDSVVAENDGTIELRYEAYDVEGAPVTDFRVLYKSLSFSDSALKLVEKNDGSAKLEYTVPRVNATEGIDVPQIYTTTIPATGKSSIVQINIKANAKAVAVKGYDGNANILEGASVDVCFVNNWSGNPFLTWYDQYDRAIDGATNRIPAGYYVAVKYVGDALTFSNDATNPSDADPSYKYYKSADAYVTVTAVSGSTNNILPQTVEFALADATGKIVSGSEKKIVLNVVDIKQCTSFNITNKWTSKALNGEDTISFSVTGVLANGSTVAVPNDDKLGYIEYALTNATDYDWKTVTGSAIEFKPNYTDQDLFKDKSVTKPDGTHPNRFLEAYLTASIYTEDGALKDTASSTISVGVDPKKAVSFTLKDTWQSYWINADVADAKAYINATKGVISYDDLIKYAGQCVTNYDNYNDINNWDGTVLIPVQITVSKLTEGTKGIQSDSLLVTANAVNVANNMISGAEIGDTFVATYKFENATLTIQFTVGADKTANFSNTSDICNWR